MQDLLYLVHRIPYPPNKGDKIRSYHTLRHLCRRYRVHLGTFIDDPQDWAYVDQLKQLCAETCFIQLDPRLAKARALPALATKQPLTLPYYHDKKLHAWVKDLLAKQKIDKVLVFSSPMAQYAEHARSVRRVIDFVDIDSDKWRQYAACKKWPLSWLYRRESRLLLECERQIAADFDNASFVSEAEADLFRALAPAAADKVGYFNNGVDAEYFSPQSPYANPYPDDAPVLVFTGAMDYWANVDAVDWFAQNVFPRVRAAVPQTRFCIVGARPSPQVMALASLPGITVTGAVPDVRPYLAHAALSVAPLRIARGIQNKVLEAMAMEKVVVASPQAMEGINAVTGKELFVATDEEDYAMQILNLLQSDKAKVGQAARARVLDVYSWESSLKRLDTLLNGPHSDDEEKSHPIKSEAA